MIYVLLFFIIYSAAITFILWRICGVFTLNVDFEKIEIVKEWSQIRNIVVNIRKNNPKGWLREIMCGKYSGLKWCDITFFMTIWKIVCFIDDIWYRTDFLRKIYLEWCHKHYGHPGYIVCPFCVLLKRKPIKINLCENNPQRCKCH